MSLSARNWVRLEISSHQQTTPCVETPRGVKTETRVAGSHFGRVPLAILYHVGCRDAFLVAACHGEKLGDFPIKEAWSSRFLGRHLPMIFGFQLWDGRPSRM